MSADNGEKTDSSTSVVRIEEKNSSADMASVLQGLQSSLTQLAEVSKAQKKLLITSEKIFSYSPTKRTRKSIWIRRPIHLT